MDKLKAVQELVIGLQDGADIIAILDLVAERGILTQLETNQLLKEIVSRTSEVATKSSLKENLPHIYEMMEQSAVWQANYSSLHGVISDDYVPVGLFLSSDALSLQLWGWEIVLCDDGTWFQRDTSGG
jgi:hypothetical protein